VLTRRRLLLGTGQLALVALLAGCGLVGGPASELGARPPGSHDGRWPEPGVRTLEVADERKPLLYVPEDLPEGEPAPLVVFLHGARMTASEGLELLRDQADDAGFLLLAMASRGETWDAITDEFGPDAEMTNRALEEVFSTVPVDPARISLAGFSDGASYALGLGLANGELFRGVIAFSPGEVPSGERVGTPPVFIAHGDEDEVLPFEVTEERIVPALEEGGYDVTFREFSGGHEVDPDVADDAIAWLEDTAPG
jgi:predicted esterase